MIFLSTREGIDRVLQPQLSLFVLFWHQAQHLGEEKTNAAKPQNRKYDAATVTVAHLLAVARGRSLQRD